MGGAEVIQVRLGSIPWNAGHGMPAPGEWMLTLAELKGWWERVPDATETSPHWSGSGQTASATRQPGRQLIGEGMLLATTEEGPGSLRAAFDAIARISSTTLVVAEDDLVRTAEARITQVESTRISPLSAVITINLTCDDPLRYSAESRRLANGTVLLPNRGDVTAFPRIALTGPHGAISIAHPGGTWTFPALASGSRLVDFREQRVWNGNQRVFGAAAGSGPVPRVLPGGASWTVSGLSTGRAVLTRAEAWS